MILYLDTSSLVKLYLEEIYADSVRLWVGEAEVIATSCIAYPEAMSALARRYREGDLDKTGFGQVRNALIKQWPEFAVFDLDEIAAGNLAVKHGLRGFDAIHLEAAIAARTQSVDIAIAFSSFDTQLNTAAEAEGFNVLDANTSME